MKDNLYWPEEYDVVSRDRKAIMRSIMRGHEYDVKAIAAAFDVPDEFESGECSEFEAREIMKEEILVHCLGEKEETIRRVYKLLRDDWYMYNE